MSIRSKFKRGFNAVITGGGSEIVSGINRHRQEHRDPYRNEPAKQAAKRAEEAAAKREREAAARDEAFAAQQAEASAAAERQQQDNAESISAANAGPVTGKRMVGGQVELVRDGSQGTTFAPRGMDQTNQGVAEQQWGITGEEYFKPGEAEQWSAENRGVYGRRGVGERTSSRIAGRLERGADENAGSQYWDQVAGRFNDGSSANVEADLGGYYDRAFDRGAGQINRQLAARGQFGSTRGMQQIGDYGAALQAERVNREADYSLRRSADELAWTRGGADVAFGAAANERAYLTDAASQAQAAQAQQFDRLGQAHGQLLQDDSFALTSRNSGMIAANNAQDQRDERIQDQADNQLRFAQILAGYGTHATDSALAGENQVTETGLAAADDSYNQAYAAEQARYQNILNAGQQAGVGFGYYQDWKKNQGKS